MNSKQSAIYGQCIFVYCCQLTRFGSLAIAARLPSYYLHLLVCVPSFPFEEEAVVKPPGLCFYLTFDLAPLCYLIREGTRL